MTNRNRSATVVGALLCGAMVWWSAPSQAQDLTVYAASSMGQVIEKLGEQFVSEHGKLSIRYVLASSSTLAQQIIAGAPADLFISANQAWMTAVVRAGMIEPTSVIPVAGNTLVVVGFSGSNSNGVTNSAVPTIEPQFPLAQLMAQTVHARLAIGDPSHVPAGQYARQALKSLGLWRDVSDKLAPMPDARATLTMVARNETPYGIVYASDARLSLDVKIIGRFPSTSHLPILYFAAPLANLKTAAAQDFARFLTSEDAEVIFRRHGFCHDC